MKAILKKIRNKRKLKVLYSKHLQTKKIAIQERIKVKK